MIVSLLLKFFYTIIPQKMEKKKRECEFDLTSQRPSGSQFSKGKSLGSWTFYLIRFFMVQACDFVLMWWNSTNTPNSTLIQYIYTWYSNMSYKVTFPSAPNTLLSRYPSSPLPPTTIGEGSSEHKGLFNFHIFHTPKKPIIQPKHLPVIPVTDRPFRGHLLAQTSGSLDGRIATKIKMKFLFWVQVTDSVSKTKKKCVFESMF